MSNNRTNARSRHHEQGQTILLVAIALVSLLAMAALAIDVVALYVASGETQRAADAAALLGAKAFVDSGITTDPANTTRQTLAQNMATSGINAILQENKIAGVAPALAVAPTFNFSNPGNPQITVTLQRTNLPVFFARIWGKRSISVSASATAEAYNASNSQSNTGNYVPIKPKGVKPLLISNKDPATGLQFVDRNSGASIAPNVIGEQFTPPAIQPYCQSGPPTLACVAAGTTLDPPAGQFLPAQVTPNPNNLCPSCLGSSNFEQSIECSDFNPYSCGGPTPNVNLDTVITSQDVNKETRNGVKCLIHDPADDTLVATNFQAGTGPMEITARSGPQSGNLVTTSSSVATLPIIDTPVLPGGQARIVGFLQVFINDANSSGNVRVTATILNVVGCGNNPSTGPPVSGGGFSPIPVRLIHQ